MKNINKIGLIVPSLMLLLVVAVPVDAQTKQAKERLVKCENEATIYSVIDDKTAKAFPDAQTFYSYGHEFTKVETLPCETGLPFKMNGKMQNKHGKGFRLVKKIGDPAVFQCAYKNSYFLCDKVANEQEAEKQFGKNWPKQVYETQASTMDMLVWHWKKQNIVTAAATK